MSSTPYRYYWAAWGALPVLAGLMLLSVAKGSVPLSLTQVLGLYGCLMCQFRT